MSPRGIACTLVCVAASLPLVAADAAPARAAWRRPPVTIDAFGHWTLARLGLPALNLPTATARARVSVTYRLPAMAKQGPANWYLMNLHFRLTLARRSRSGLVYLYGDTDGRESAQIKFGTYRDRAGVLRTVWSSGDYIRGDLVRRTRSRTIEGRFENYLQFKGVRPGRNVLTISLERYGRVRVESLHIFRDSGITYSPIAPAKLRLHLALPQKKVHAGETFTIPFRISNHGDRAAHQVVLNEKFPPGALSRIDDTRTRFPTLKAPVSGKLRFRALHAGTFRLAIFVQSSANDPGSAIEVPVAPAPASATGGWDWVGRATGAALLVVGLALFAVARRRKRIASSNSPLAGAP